MRIPFKGIATLLAVGAVWAGFRLARELGGATPPRSAAGGTVTGQGFEMTRTFVCSKCGFTTPATAEEITRRTQPGLAFAAPDGSGQVYRCDREGTPTLELRVHAVPKP